MLEAKPRGGRILIVDDEETIRFAMKEYLESRGFRVDCASTGGEARSRLEPGRYAVVVADLRLSSDRQSEGLDVLAQVRQRCPGTATVLLTAYGSGETEREARRIGIDALLHKSQELSEIAVVVGLLSEGSPGG